MKIGELAKETGVSVRTLHHYDEIGLLTPSIRSKSSHRIYNKSDIVRLHCILSLKRLNLSLEEIRDVIGKSNSQIEKLLDRNIESIEVEIHEKEETLRTLRGARQFLIYREEVQLSELTDMIKDIVLSQRYLSENQLSVLDEREEFVGVKEMSRIFNDIPRMTAEVLDAMDRKLPPSDPQVLAVVKRWFEIAETLVGDNEEIKAALEKMIEENPEVLERRQLNEEMLDYMRKARSYLEDTGELGMSN